MKRGPYLKYLQCEDESPAKLPKQTIHNQRKRVFSIHI